MTQVTLTPVYLRYPGTVAYEQALHEMQEFNATRTPDTTDELWFLEHPPVYTLGINASRDHLLDAGDTPVVQVDRGGQVTWHGPGQLVVYVLLNLKRKKLGVRQLVCGLERSVINTLNEYGITAEGREDAPGVYTDGAKIASIGLRIKHNCCYHGIAVNVNPDLGSFAGINPCGYADLKVTRTCDLGGPENVATLAADLLPKLLTELQLVATME
jgi:lipoyl(octanoyl) transferase